MATVGHIEAFNPDNELISAYLERVELFFIANGVAEGKQVATLLSVIGGKTYALLSDLLAPAKPADKSLKELKEASDSLRAKTSGYCGAFPVPSTEPGTG